MKSNKRIAFLAIVFMAGMMVVAIEPTEEEDLAALPDAINFVDNSEQEHMRNFKKISSDLKIYEEEYSACIKEIPDSEYSEDKIDECVGKNFIKVILDIKYETLKVMARADTKLRQFFIHSCYMPAGTEEEFSVGCDNMERDTLDLLWNGLDFVQLLELNREKYLVEYGKVSREAFKAVIAELTDFSKEFFEILDEIDSHKEVTILRLKTLIDDRTKLLLEEAKLHPDMVQPAAVHHTIEIQEQISGGDAIRVHELPGKQLEDDFQGPMFNRNMKQNNDEARRRLQQNHALRQNIASQIKYNPASNKVNGGSQEKQNSRRVLNSGQNYSGLHAKHNFSKFGSAGSSLKNQALKASMLNSLNRNAGRGQPTVKQVHSTHFGQQTHL
jgi:hypothetical protein